MSDVQHCEARCPECGHYPTRERECDACWGKGRHDLYEEDPILFPFGLGQKFERCHTCRGHGRLIWCPECQCDLHCHDGPLEWPRQIRDEPTTRSI